MLNSKGVYLDFGDTPLNLGDTISEIRFQFLRYNGEGNEPNCLIFTLYRTPIALHENWQSSFDSVGKSLRSPIFYFLLLLLRK